MSGGVANSTQTTPTDLHIIEDEKQCFYGESLVELKGVKVRRMVLVVVVWSGVGGSLQEGPGGRGGRGGRGREEREGGEGGREGEGEKKMRQEIQKVHVCMETNSC